MISTIFTEQERLREEEEAKGGSPWYSKLIDDIANKIAQPELTLAFFKKHAVAL